MSASLPRIKTVQEIQNPPQPKFRKLTLNSDNQEERKASLKALKTERLKSLSRYSTVQEQKEYKNQKIHLNLIERKLLNGTYDEKKQTGHELNSLKQKRDHFKVETALKTREVDRFKRLLQEVKEEIAELLVGKDAAEKKVSQAKEKYESQVAQTESVRENQMVLQHMLKTRQDININLCKRKNELQGYLNHLTSLRALMEKQLRELNDRVKLREVNLEDLIQKTVKDRNERNEIMSKHQQRILKRKEDQILQSQRSKQYVAELDQLQMVNQLKEFNSVYQKILANLFMSNLCSSTMTSLHQKYQSYQYAYRKVYSYRSFDPDQPKTLVDRFMEHPAEKADRELTINSKEVFIEKLRRTNEALKEQLMLSQQELMQNQEKMTKSQLALQQSQHQQIIASLEQQRKDNQESAQKVRQQLVRLLALLKKKGGRRSSSKNQAAAKNMQALSDKILQLAKEN